jgi:hypothetical protein
VPRRVRRNAVNAILSFTPRIQSAFRVVPPKIPRDGAPASADRSLLRQFTTPQ